MILIFAIIAGLFPRLGFLILWLFTPLVNQAFDTVLFPLLGIIFLPMTTLMYALVVGALGPVTFWGWMLILLGLLLDLKGYADVAAQKDAIMPKSTTPKSSTPASSTPSQPTSSGS